VVGGEFLLGVVNNFAESEHLIIFALPDINNDESKTTIFIGYEAAG